MSRNKLGKKYRSDGHTHKHVGPHVVATLPPYTVKLTNLRYNKLLGIFQIPKKDEKILVQLMEVFAHELKNTHIHTMSIALECANGWVLDHSQLITKTYKNVHKQPTENNSSVEDHSKHFCFDSNLFKIITPFLFEKESSNKTAGIMPRKKPKKRSHSGEKCSPDDHPEVCAVRLSLESIISLSKKISLFTTRPQDQDFIKNNIEARTCSTSFFEDICQEKLIKCNGGNSLDYPLLVSIHGKDYLIPNNSIFFCCDVFELNQQLTDNSKFDLIIMDPPWWNKYVRRRKARQETGGYQMMYNDEVSSLPVASWLAASALVAVWCTNCARHEQDIISTWFPRWGLHYVTTWYWVKVTRSGEPVCQFSPPPGKQPYERILFGATRDRVSLPPDKRLVVSVPSAIHSHKPPLSEVLKPYLPREPRCLELFARYMLPHWTSVGDQVLSLQSAKLYTETRHDDR